MAQGKNNNLWLHKSSVIFVKKLMKNNMINQQEYNTIMKKLYEIYNIKSTACIKTIKIYNV